MHYLDSMDEMVSIMEQSDAVLVGLGDEFEMQEYLDSNERYQGICREIADAKKEWVIPYVNHLFLKEHQGLRNAYSSLEQLLCHRNYFIISAVMNGFLHHTSLAQERVAELCGSYTLSTLKHEKDEPGKIKTTPNEVLQYIEWCMNGEKPWNSLSDECRLNSLYSEDYSEAGYLPRWEKYTDWLSHTLHKKLCVLEFGVNMRYSGLIRFRFEKITECNLSAQMVRINQAFYYIPLGLSGRGYAIRQNAVQFLTESYRSDLL